MYIVTSKPKRISEYSGVVHIIFTLFINYNNKNCKGKFLTANTILHLTDSAFVRITRLATQDFPYFYFIQTKNKKSPDTFQYQGFLKTVLALNPNDCKCTLLLQSRNAYLNILV